MVMAFAGWPFVIVLAVVVAALVGVVTWLLG